MATPAATDRAFQEKVGETVAERLAGKVAVVTGGASGIGEATVRRFTDEGARVVIADVQEDRGAALSAEIGESAIFRRTDVSVEDDVESAVAAAVDTFGRIDVMVNNAGFIGPRVRIADTTAEGYRQVFDVLVLGAIFGCKHAARVMAAHGSGSIITTASIASVASGYGPHLYTAAKSALAGLTRSVAAELSQYGVRVNAVCPGGTLTPMNLDAMGGESARPVLTGYLAQMQPIHRAGLPEDMAAAYLWLAGDETTFVTGQLIVVDGGATGASGWSPLYEGAMTATD